MVRAAVSTLGVEDDVQAVNIAVEAVPSVSSFKAHDLTWLASLLFLPAPTGVSSFIENQQSLAAVWAALAICATIGFMVPLVPFYEIAGTSWLHPILVYTNAFSWAFAALFLLSASLLAVLNSIGVGKLRDQTEFKNFCESMGLFYLYLPMRMGCIGLWCVTNGLTLMFAIRFDGLEIVVLVACVVLQSILGTLQKKKTASLMRARAGTEVLEPSSCDVDVESIRQALQRYYEQELRSNFWCASREEFLKKFEILRSETVTKVAQRIYDAWEDKRTRELLSGTEKSSAKSLQLHDHTPSAAPALLGPNQCSI